MIRPAHPTGAAGTALATLGAAALLTGCIPGTAGPGSADGDAGVTATTEVTVLGAASTRVINEQLADLAGDLTPPQSLEFVNAGSSTLVQQLADGSPGDVLITADEATMGRAVDNGSVEDPQVVATNSMVMVVPAGNPAEITGVDDSLDDASVVLCDPQVPCGTVSRALIEELGVDIDPVSLEHSVSDVLGKVISGEADAGWVYRTDAAAAGEAVEVIDIPGAGDHPNSLVAAVTAGTDTPAGSRELVELLTSEKMARVWQAHGFTPAP
ncbi:molybdate ABC transporter substrate-binding protein [Corynebacterium halotolerans]|uniref:Putative molybdate transport system solute-binding protein n=1 Tax=Corynebacterium halotolerans YIM 70093 = DSM 44683 TaxID=1121362 RepID=M1NLC6_9CORY|nr:molybdate ABC transporter substrate-binding protein [Corynebacterium halotolerans]AGF72213.1 putative molybdate transport system solute-binding protein [Corynebacterium halotolerans YIM 70093 = DSM 44683]